MQEPCPHPQPQEEQQQHTRARQLYVEQPDSTASALLHTFVGQIIGPLQVKPGTADDRADFGLRHASGLAPDDV